MSKEVVGSSGIGFFGLLGIVFIVLKLIGIIDWSWLWVLAPLWGPTALFLALAVILLIGFGVLFAISAAIDMAHHRRLERGWQKSGRK